jgi:hypothetical protein
MSFEGIGWDSRIGFYLIRCLDWVGASLDDEALFD